MLQIAILRSKVLGFLVSNNYVGCGAEAVMPCQQLLTTEWDTTYMEIPVRVECASSREAFFGVGWCN